MFLNPYILAGLGGAAIPLLLHLLARARYRNIDWGAMMFLRGIHPSHALSARIRQYGLLGLRMLLVAAIAIALARPVARGKWAGTSPEARIRAVIILDRSYSMAYEEAGKSRFDKARDAALGVLSSLRRGDEVALVFMGDQVEAKDPTSSLQVAARELAEAQVSNGSADISAALDKARAILGRDARFSRELYLICDRQALSWKKILASGVDASWLHQPIAPVRFYVVPVGGEESDNVAIESVELAEPIAIRGHPTEVEVRLHNYSARPRSGIQVWLQPPPDAVAPVGSASADRLLGRPNQITGPLKRDPAPQPISVNIPPRATTTARLPITFAHAGSRILTAAINGGELEADNRFDTAIEVLDPIQVLIVSGDEAGPGPGESAFLRLALTPNQNLRAGPGNPAAVTVKTVEDFPSIDLNKFQVIILANIPQVTADQARALEQRVYEGCSLIVCPGSLSRIDDYNNTLFRDAQGILPAALLEPAAADGSEATTIARLDNSHPIFRFRASSRAMPAAVIARYFPTAPRPDAKVLGAYENGQPFLIEGRRGHGRVLLLTTPLDADWGTLPLDGRGSADSPANALDSTVPSNPFFLPFVQSMLLYAAAPAVPQRNLAPGESIIANFAEPLASAEIFRNEQALGTVPITGGGAQLRFAHTELSGIYRLQARLKSGALTNIHYVVRSPRSDSDLAPLTPAQWEACQRLLGFVRLDPFSQPIATSIAADRGGQELWLFLLVAAILLGIGELWLASASSRQVPT